jgi:RNA polymerase sigma factor (sigma-70 family)
VAFSVATIVHDDGQLVQAARKGDQAAFAELVHQHRRRIWSVCYRITENSYDAEDAVQDCLIAAWHHLDAFRGKSSFGTWIYRIAANSALAITRRRRPEVSDDQLPEAAHDDFSQRVVDVDTVGRALRQLPLSFRSVLVLRELCDLSYEQIAEHEGIGVQTVKSRLNRARTMLRAALVAAGAPPD